MSAKLYEYAVFHNPKQRRDSGGNDVTPPAVIITGPVLVVASSEQAVQIQAARAIPEKYLDSLAEVEIAIRPF